MPRQFSVKQLMLSVLVVAGLFGGLFAWKSYQRIRLAADFRDCARCFRIEANKVRKGAPAKAKQYEDMAYSFEYAAVHGKLPVLNRETGKWEP